jgi:hypothetical protein
MSPIKRADGIDDFRSREDTPRPMHAKNVAQNETTSAEDAAPLNPSAFIASCLGPE